MQIILIGPVPDNNNKINYDMTMSIVATARLLCMFVKL